MILGQQLQVGAAALEFIAHPPYALAHPGEASDPVERCTQCAIALRRETGEVVLLWLAGGKDWTVSRADPAWAHHREQLAAAGGWA